MKKIIIIILIIVSSNSFTEIKRYFYVDKQDIPKEKINNRVTKVDFKKMIHKRIT